MRLADGFRKSVVFFGEYKDNGAFVGRGTGFFLTYNASDGIAASYLVTARHVARLAKANDWSIRFNTSDGGSFLESSALEWLWPNDPNIDLAACLYTPPSHCEVTSLPHVMLLPEERTGEKWVMHGTPIFVTGLFRFHPGRERNLVMTHSGHIALMPEDDLIPVEDHFGKLMVRGYVAQAQTHEGASGSPVFTRVPIKVLAHPGLKIGMFPEAYGAPFLLGLWQSAWRGDPSGELKEYASASDDTVPTSFGVVIPTTEIVNLLESEPLAQLRKSADLEDFKAHHAAMKKEFTVGSSVDLRMKQGLVSLLSSPPNPSLALARDRPAKKALQKRKR